MPATLETVDIDGVEILSAGGPYHGAGSPKGGDTFTAEFLASLADANAVLAEVRPAIKIGHNPAQKLLTDSGLSADEMPAAGHLTNIRVGERDGVAKLLADMKAVPAKLAALMQSGAFRTRSVEIGKVVAQSGEKAGEKMTAITGIALLGAKAPAVRTLDDIVALYSDEGVDDNFGDEPTEIYMTDTREMEVGELELVLPGDETVWVAPFRKWGGDIELSERVDWREKEKETMPVVDPPADTQVMKITDLSDEQLRTLATTFGLGDEIEGDELRGAVANKMTDLVADETEVTPPAPTPGTVTLSEADVAEFKAQAGLMQAMVDERRIERREAVVVSGGVDTGKLAPAEADTWRALYDANPEAATKAIEDMPVNADLARAFGAEGEGGDGDTKDEQEEAEYREFAALLGLPDEEA